MTDKQSIAKDVIPALLDALVLIKSGKCDDPQMTALRALTPLRKLAITEWLENKDD